MTESMGNLAEQTAQHILEIVLPGSTLTSITVPDGSFSNYTHIVTAQLPDGSPRQIVVRRYKVFGNYDRGEKARREFKTFELLNQHQVPAPEALYLDEKGDVLEIPGIVTGFVEGKLLMDVPSEPLEWAHKLAKTLAKIHSIPCGEEQQEFLLKGNVEASWVVKYDQPPTYMQNYPGGVDVWQLMRERYPGIQTDIPVLLHIDYWSGNILWHANEISAVIDWEEAAYGDPAVDLAYARMNMILMGVPEAADEFLRLYESVRGCRVKNLGFWELAASVRPMTDPVDWKVANPDGPNKDTFLRFIEDARQRTK
jgi:aminoglycoside phosphotransferase (APT) family kinase protein